MTRTVDSCAPWLEGRARSVHSQFGEDGLIEAVFEKIGTANQWCFEVGASDGVTFSNTKIWRDRGWHSVLIEKDAALFDRLATFSDARTAALCADIDAHSLEDALAYYAAPRDLDLGVIDIDGQDYWVWSGMLRFRPRVILVEFSPYVKSPDFVPLVGTDGGGGQNQAGLQAMRDLGRDKGYVEVAKTYVNLLFVASEEI